MATPSRNFRVDDLTWARWKEAAASRAVDVTRLVHAAMERELAHGALVIVRRDDRLAEPRAERSPAAKGKPRTSACPHRVPAGSYCSRGCD